MEIIQQMIAPITERYGGELPSLTAWSSRTSSYSNPGKLHLSASCRSRPARSSERPVQDRQLRNLCKVCSNPAAISPDLAQRVADRMTVAAATLLTGQLAAAATHRRTYSGDSVADLLSMSERYSNRHAGIKAQLRKLAAARREEGATPLVLGTLSDFANRSRQSAGTDLCVSYESLRVLGVSRAEVTAFFTRLAQHVRNGFDLEQAISFAIEASRAKEPTVDALPNNLVLDRTQFESVGAWMRAEWANACDVAAQVLADALRAAVADAVANPKLVVGTTGTGTRTLDEAAERSGWSLVTTPLGQYRRLVVVPAALLTYLSQHPNIVQVIATEDESRLDHALRADPETTVRLAAVLMGDNAELTAYDAVRTAAVVP